MQGIVPLHRPLVKLISQLHIIFEYMKRTEVRRYHPRDIHSMPMCFRGNVSAPTLDGGGREGGRLLYSLMGSCLFGTNMIL